MPPIPDQYHAPPLAQVRDQDRALAEVDAKRIAVAPQRRDFEQYVGHHRRPATSAAHDTVTNTTLAPFSNPRPPLSPLYRPLPPSSPPLLPKIR